MRPLRAPMPVVRVAVLTLELVEKPETSTMFKKKPDIPPRPRIPTVEQILEDIENSSYDDVVFEKCSYGGKFPTSESTASPNSAEETYRKVKQFEDNSTVLKNLLDKLQDQSEALKVSDMELRAMADDIRKQALQALK